MLITCYKNENNKYYCIEHIYYLYLDTYNKHICLSGVIIVLSCIFSNTNLTRSITFYPITNIGFYRRHIGH